MKSRLFFDTNFLLDLTNRERPQHEQARLLFGLLETGYIRAAVSPHSFTDYYYIARDIKALIRQDFMALFLETCEIAVLDESLLRKALHSNEPDFEDGVVRACAEAWNADFIITRDVKAFVGGPVAAVSAADYLASIAK